MCRDRESPSAQVVATAHSGLAEERGLASGALAFHEASERVLKLGLQSQELGLGRVLSQLTLEVATGVRDAQIGAMGGDRGAAARCAKRAARMLRVGGSISASVVPAS
jgi:hypothetical protein